MNKFLSFFSACVLVFVSSTAIAASINHQTRDINSYVFGDYQAGFNAQASVVNSANLAAFSSIMASTESYNHLSINFNVGSAFAGASLEFQIAADAGYGGSTYINGGLVDTRAYDVWYSETWDDDLSQLLIANIGSAAGAQSLDFYWAENCCFGMQYARFRVNGGDWQELSVANLNAVPEPGALALLGLGLTGLCITRRKKA